MATQTINIGGTDFTIGKMPFGVLRKNVELLAAVTDIQPGSPPAGPQLNAMVELVGKAAGWFAAKAKDPQAKEPDPAVAAAVVDAFDGMDYDDAMNAILPAFQIVMGRGTGTGGVPGEAPSPPESP